MIDPVLRSPLLRLPLCVAVILFWSACSKKTPEGKPEGNASQPATSVGQVGEASPDTKSADAASSTQGTQASQANLSTKPNQTAPSNQAASSAQPAEPTCFNLVFSHRATARHDDLEDCSHHRNLLTLKHSEVNSKSICVRINGTPVQFDIAKGKAGAPTQLLLGPVAGPKSKISVSYCLQGHQCTESCVIPKDAFMDALAGADRDSGGKKPVGHWDAADSGTDVAAQVDAEIRKELDGGADLSVFSGWIPGEESPSCALPKSAHGKTQDGSEQSRS